MIKKISGITAGIVALAAVLTSGTELYQSVVTGSSFGNSSAAIEQKRSWEKNLACVQTGKFFKVTNQFNAEIGTLVCASGDVLISGKKAGSETPSYKWVSWDSIGGIALNFSVLPKAHAQAYATVACQRFDKGYLKQRIITSTGCYDQWVNTYNGMVESWQASPCNCGGF